MPDNESFHAELLASEDFTSYSLRSTFFFRRLREIPLWSVVEEVMRLPKARNGFSWRARTAWGIEMEAWERIQSLDVDPLVVFCHPKVIQEQPRLLLYYRTLSLLSQKGLVTLAGGNVAKLESGGFDQLDDDWCLRLVVAVNSVLSAWIIAAAEIHPKRFSDLQLAAIGATIQGSWNNKVGKEGEAQIRTIIVNHLRREIIQVVGRDQLSWDYTPDRHQELLDHIEDVRLVRLKHGFHLLFSSEPDVSLRNRDNEPMLAIEVKAGTDKAGALERLGAGMKSFERDRDLNPRVKTVYVVRAITPELRRRIEQGNPFDYLFGLAELLTDEKTQKTLANLVLRIVIGKERTP